MKRNLVIIFFGFLSLSAASLSLAGTTSSSRFAFSNIQSIFGQSQSVLRCQEISTLNAPLGTKCITSTNIRYERILVYSGKRYYKEISNYTGDTSKLYGWKVISKDAKTAGFIWTDPTSKGNNYWDKTFCQRVVAADLRVPSRSDYEMGFKDGIDEVLPGSNFLVFWTSDYIPDKTGYKDQSTGYRYVGNNGFNEIQVEGEYSGMYANIRCLKQ